MSEKQFKVSKYNDLVKIEIFGFINEDTQFNQITIDSFKKIEIDLNHVQSINSCGIREWIKWISNFQNCELFLSKCPKTIVDQINMIQGFLPKNAKVISFYVPFYSEETGSEKNVLFTYGKEFDESGVRIPSNITDDQGNVMNLDVIESKYFRFIKN